MGKLIVPAAVGAVNEMEKSAGVSGSSEPSANVTTWPSAPSAVDAVQPS